MPNTFKSPWTPEKIKNLRRHFSLNQAGLALILGLKQQRISEWELGKHSMKQAYTQLLDSAEKKLVAIRRQAGADKRRYEKLILEVFGVELQYKEVVRGD